MEEGVISAIFNAGQIVQQCVEPYIYNVLLIKGNRNTPIKGSAGNAQILQALLYEINHFVATASRLDKIRMLFNKIKPPILVLAHLEEVAFLLHLLYRTMAVGAAVIFVQLALQPIGLAGHAVQALVVLFIDIALFINFLQCVLYYLMMTLLASAQEVIIRNMQALPEQLKVSNNSVNILDGGYALFLSLTLNL